MSDREFETYLSLLARFLRLSGSQRESIEAELRDHMEQRLDELLERGLTREQAIAAALDEFGDAAGLAQRFTQLAHLHRRRLIMRYSFASLCVLALTATVFMSILPERRDYAVGPVAIAEEAPKPPEAIEYPRDWPGAPSGRSGAAIETEKRLAKPIDVNFQDTPLLGVIEEIRESCGVDILLNLTSLQNSGLDIESPVSFRLIGKPAYKALRLALQLVGGELIPLDYIIDEDGIVIVSTNEDLSRMVEIRMYNVSDLIGKEPLVTAPGAGAFGPLGGRAPISPLTGSTALIPLIQEQIEPDSWRSSGGLVGVISYYNNTLIVKQTAKVHEQVYRFLQMLRLARDSETGAVISTVSLQSPPARSETPAKAAGD